MKPEIVGQIKFNPELNESFRKVARFSKKCYIGCQNVNFPLDVYEDNDGLRILKYLDKIWVKTFGENDWGYVACYDEIFRDWHRDKGTGKKVLVLPVSSGSWVQFEKGYSDYTHYFLNYGEIFVFDGKVRHKGFVDMGFVMFEK